MEHGEWRITSRGDPRVERVLRDAARQALTCSPQTVEDLRHIAAGTARAGNLIVSNAAAAREALAAEIRTTGSVLCYGTSSSLVR